MELPILSEEVRVRLISQEKITEEIFAGTDLTEKPLENEATGRKNRKFSIQYKKKKEKNFWRIFL
ncbi:hypothetical protein M5E86_05070 [Blautia wexlerae]|nr:hypothetical protein M5E86_05070 [Blautia wexlerae]